MNDIFWPVFTAVLAANLLTVAFIWAGKHVGRREENGIEVPSVYLMTMLLPIGFVILGLWTLAPQDEPPPDDASVERLLDYYASE